MTTDKPASAPPAVRAWLYSDKTGRELVSLHRWYGALVEPAGVTETPLVAASAQVRAVEPRCPNCGGNKGDAPCLYPRECQYKPAAEPALVAQGLLAELRESRTNFDGTIMSDIADPIGCDCGLLRRAEEVIADHARIVAALEEKAAKFMWQVRDTCVRAEKAEASLAACRADAERLNALRDNSWDLRSFNMWGGEDVGWRVIEHHQGDPLESEVAIAYTDDPREAIDAAVKEPGNG